MGNGNNEQFDTPAEQIRVINEFLFGIDGQQPPVITLFNDEGDITPFEEVGGFIDGDYSNAFSFFSTGENWGSGGSWSGLGVNAADLLQLFEDGDITSAEFNPLTAMITGRTEMEIAFPDLEEGTVRPVFMYVSVTSDGIRNTRTVFPDGTTQEEVDNFFAQAIGDDGIYLDPAVFDMDATTLDVSNAVTSHERWGTVAYDNIRVLLEAGGYLIGEPNSQGLTEEGEDLAILGSEETVYLYMLPDGTIEYGPELPEERGIERDEALALGTELARIVTMNDATTVDVPEVSGDAIDLTQVAALDGTFKA